MGGGSSELTATLRDMGNPIVPRSPVSRDIFTRKIVPVLNRVRGQVLDQKVGLRMYRVYLMEEIWSGAEVDDGGQIVDVIWSPIDPSPVVVVPTPRVAEPAGATEEGMIEVRQVNRLYERERLMGLTSFGASLPRNWRFEWVVVPKDQIHGRTYFPASEPEMRPTEWRVKLRPTNRVVTPPE